MDNETIINNTNMILPIDQPKKNTLKTKKIILYSCIFAFILLAVLYYFYVQYAVVFNSNTIYYMYTNECPNCQIVIEYMNETNAEQKLIDLEISLNKFNMDLPTSLPYFKKATKECELPLASVGVPFVYYNKECFIGRIEVIDMLNKTINEVQ
jgi:glutaredoxin-related protein